MNLFAYGVLSALAIAATGTTETSGKLARSWQGAWVVRNADYPGSIQAWNVRGDEVTVYDAGRRSMQDEHFVVVSPCRLERTRRLDDGDLLTADTFVFASDGLHVARAPAAGGFRRDGVVTACIGDQVFVFDTRRGTCTRWDAHMHGPPREPNGECSISATDVGSSFVFRPLLGGSDTRVNFYGDALLSGPLLGDKAERSPSFDRAVANANSLRPR